MSAFYGIFLRESKLPCRSISATIVMNYFSRLSFAKAVWSFEIFVIALEMIGSKEYKMNKRNYR